MAYNPDLDHRRSHRLLTWDYRDTGAYFVTICTHDRSPLLARFVAGDLVLKPFGEIVEDVWHKVVGQSPGEFIVMPNHVHGIVWIQRQPFVEPEPTVGAEQLNEPCTVHRLAPGVSLVSPVAVAQPLRPDPALTPRSRDTESPGLRNGLRDGLEPGSLAVIIRTFKSAVSKRINRLRDTPGDRVWQDDYHERIVRNERELNAVREDILDNPRKWAEDKHNPAAFRNQPQSPAPPQG